MNLPELIQRFTVIRFLEVYLFRGRLCNTYITNSVQDLHLPPRTSPALITCCCKTSFSIFLEMKELDSTTCARTPRKLAKTDHIDSLRASSSTKWFDYHFGNVGTISNWHLLMTLTLKCCTDCDTILVPFSVILNHTAYESEFRIFDPPFLIFFSHLNWKIQNNSYIIRLITKCSFFLL